MYGAGQAALCILCFTTLQCFASPVQAPPGAMITLAPRWELDDVISAFDSPTPVIDQSTTLEFKKATVHSAAQSISTLLVDIPLSTISYNVTKTSGLHTILSLQLESRTPFSFLPTDNPFQPATVSSQPATVSLHICVPTPSWVPPNCTSNPSATQPTRVVNSPQQTAASDLDDNSTLSSIENDLYNLEFPPDIKKIISAISDTHIRNSIISALIEWTSINGIYLPSLRGLLGASGLLGTDLIPNDLDNAISANITMENQLKCIIYEKLAEKKIYGSCSFAQINGYPISRDAQNNIVMLALKSAPNWWFRSLFSTFTLFRRLRKTLRADLFDPPWCV